MIIRQSEPLNLETPFDRAPGFLTPNELFYVRCHFPIPQLDPSTYQLRVDGAVRNPLTLSYRDLRALPTVTTPATLECAGNSRVFLVPEKKGAQWGLGAVGTAEWTGVLLSTLLEKAELGDSAIDLIFEGADHGIPKEEPIPPEPITYARSLPCAAAVRSEILLAYQMNGRDLSPEHGFPLRAIVPGHYGMASVKWLTHIHAAREPFAGYWQTSDYAYWDMLDGKPMRRPLGPIAIKSEILQPTPSEAVPAGQPYTVRGIAWSGSAPVVRIEISDDGGTTWADAEFLDAPTPHCWRRWHRTWQTPQHPGTYTLLARATDASGASQPAAHNPVFGSYVVNQTLPAKVTVR